MLSIFNPKLISDIKVPEKQEKESVCSIILKYKSKEFPLKYFKGNLTETKNPELFGFCLQIATDMTGKCNGARTWWNRLNNIVKKDGTAKSPMTQCEAVNLYIKLSESMDKSVELSQEDRFAEICNFIESLDLQKENSNQYSSTINWIEACSLLQKQYKLFDCDLNGDGYCPKISKMAQLFGAKKASGMYLRFIDDICAVATIFACKDLKFYNDLKTQLTSIWDKKNGEKIITLPADIDYDYFSEANSNTVTPFVSEGIVAILSQNSGDDKRISEEIQTYFSENDDLVSCTGVNPYTYEVGVHRQLVKAVYRAINFEKKENDVLEMIEEITGFFSDRVSDSLILNCFKLPISDNQVDSSILNEETVEKFGNYSIEKVAELCRNALICYNAETYIEKIRLGYGNAESFKDDINQSLFEYGLRDLQENDAENYYIDWYVYNALKGYEHLIAKDRSK